LNRWDLRTTVVLMTFDLVSFLKTQRQFSHTTFGPGNRTRGIVDHIRKELREIETATDSFEQMKEFTDVVILALDAMWRLGYTPEEIATAIWTKQHKNTKRRWPDWRNVPSDEAIEHDRSADSGSDLS